MNKIEVQRGRYPDETRAIIRYVEQFDRWYVKTSEHDTFYPFAHSDAAERDVQQLINKKWNVRYGNPDPLSDIP